MRRSLFAMLFLIILLPVGTSFSAANTSQDYLPIQSGMKLKFRYIIARMEQKDKTWEVNIVRNSFPQSLTYKWLRPEKEKKNSGTRILTDLKLSRDFNPFFKSGESKATSDTAPWLSVQILSELREKGEADNFREGGSGALNWAATSLKVSEQVIYPVTINGKAEALHALRLNKGLVVWNNIQNPLILEYKPLSVPLITSITGWKLVSINY